MHSSIPYTLNLFTLLKLVYTENPLLQSWPMRHYLLLLSSLLLPALGCLYTHSVFLFKQLIFQISIVLSLRHELLSSSFCFSVTTMSYSALCTYLPAPVLSGNPSVTRIQGNSIALSLFSAST